MSWRASALASLPILVACEGLLGIDPIDHGRAPGAGNTHASGARGGTANGGGEAASGGTDGEAARSGAGGDGGSSGAGAGDGARGGEGANSGGGTENAGRAGDGGTESRAGGDSGASGGEGGAPEPPHLPGAPCFAEPGAKACSELSLHQVLACVDGTWEHSASCSSDAGCDPESAECVDFEPSGQCYQDLFPETRACVDGVAVICADDFSSSYHEPCPFGCRDGACLRGSGDELIVHFGQSEDRVRFSSPIPVCFDEASVSPESRRIIESELEAEFSRVSRVTFEFLDGCTGYPHIVRIALLDDCARTLANDLPWGRTKDALQPVEICRSYYDASGEWQETDESLLRFLVRHQFGHLLRVDLHYELSEETMMTRGFRRSEVDELRNLPLDIYHLVTSNDPQFDGALVASSGRCVTRVDGHAELARCDDSGAQRFMPVEGQLVEASDLGDGGFYLKALEPDRDDGSDLEFTDADQRDPDASFELAKVQWRGFGICAVADPTRTYLTTAHCGPYGEAHSSWHVDVWYFEELLETVTAARFRLSDTELCVRVPEVSARPVAEPNVVLQLAPCRPLDQPPSGGERFVLSAEGQIRFDKSPNDLRYVSPAYDAGRPPGKALYLEFGAGSLSKGVWKFSGPVETTTSRGVRLALTAGSPLRLEPLADPPRPEQIFDWYSFTP